MELTPLHHRQADETGADPFALMVQDFAFSLAPPERPETVEVPADGRTPSGVIELEFPKDDDALDRLLRDWFGMKLPATRCCQNHQTPWEAFHDAFFARSILAIWKASRGLGGKSHTLAALCAMEALCYRADVKVLGGSGEQSKRILESMTKLWASPTAPREALQGDPGASKQKFIWGNTIEALLASQKSVRGPHPQRLRLDEIDEMSQPILDAALGQPMNKGWIQSHVVGSSTHQYPNGTMTRMIRRATTEEGLKLFEWCFQENLEPHGWLSMAEVVRKRAMMTANAWNVEIELQEPSTEGRAINSEKVEQAFREDVTLEPYDPGQKADPAKGIEARPAGKYVTGADWAKSKNFTIIVTIRTDVRPMRVVKVTKMNKLPWPSMVKAYDDQVKEYGNQRRNCHDATGLGKVIDDLIGVQAEGFDMIGRQRKDLLSNYVGAIEHGDLVWPRDRENPDLEFCYGEHKYATIEDLYKGSKDGTTKHHLPDSISAGALAWRMADQVEAASATEDPDPQDTPHLNIGMQPGRMTGFVLGDEGAAARPHGLGRWRRPGPGGRVVVDE
jgi:hypothetical protein